MQRATSPLLPRTVAGAAATGLAILAAATPTPASALAVDMYDVEVDATVETTYAGDASGPDLEHHATLSTSTRVTAKFLANIDRAGTRITGATGEAHHTAATTGAVRSTEREYAPDWNDWWERATTCTGAGPNRNDVGRTSLRSAFLAPLTGASLTLNLADKLEVGLQCTDTGRHGGVGPRSFVIESPVDEDPLAPGGPLSVDFDLPDEATAGDKVIQLFAGPPEGQAAFCPSGLADEPHMTSCRVRFAGWISLTKVRLGDGPVPHGAPSPPAAPPKAAPPKVAPPAGPDDDLLAPLVRRSQRAKLDPAASRFRFAAACPGGCTAKATIRVPAAKGRPGRLRRLTSVSFRVPKSTTARTVQVAVPKNVRRTLRGTRDAVVDLKLRDRASGRTTPVRLRLAR